MDRINILIVDDNPKNIFSLKAIITGNDIEVYTAESGEDCLKALIKFNIDIILLDINMPDMDGYETASLIRSVNKTKMIPIIFITATDKNLDIDLKCYNIGGFDIIYKPINKEILNAKIRLIKERIFSQRELQEKIKELEKVLDINKRMKANFEKIATTDFLTNIPNRRKIDSFLRKISLLNNEVSMLMIDLDDFKKYNDHFGHQKGDIVLKDIANTILESLEKDDFLGRYGGEEFLVILPNTNYVRAKKIAEKILTNTLNRKIKRSKENDQLYLTVSIGVSSSFITDEEDLEALINKADIALYSAKNAGKNCYKFFKKEATQN